LWTNCVARGFSQLGNVAERGNRVGPPTNILEKV